MQQRSSKRKGAKSAEKKHSSRRNQPHMLFLKNNYLQERIAVRPQETQGSYPTAKITDRTKAKSSLAGRLEGK